MEEWKCACGHVVRWHRLVYPIHCFCGRVAHADGSVSEPSASRQAWRGVGDAIAAATKAVGLQPCGGCRERQQRLNELFPFGS